MKSKYYVKSNTHLVCTITDSIFYQILRGYEEPRDGISYYTEDQLRPATLEDFDYFRVCSKNHLT